MPNLLTLGKKLLDWIYLVRVKATGLLQAHNPDLEKLGPIM